MEYDFSSKQSIDEWYVNMVEQLIKQPLSQTLQKRSSTARLSLEWSYGMALTGLNSIRNNLYDSAKIHFEAAHPTLDDILREIRGFE